jgi:hypothetical protein
MKAKHANSFLPIVFLCAAALSNPLRLQAQTFFSYPEGDDVTSSLGQFQIVLDQAFVKVFNIIMTNSPLADTLVTRRLRLYHNGVLTSPTLYDPTTTIGRSDPFIEGGIEETIGALAGRAPGRTYVRDSQLIVRPAWPEPTNGAHEVHTFLKSMHLVDSFTTRIGFSVKAGMLAPTRPVCAGQVEAATASSDFPAKSFFNVYVVVDLPSGGFLPPIQLVNVDPLLVQQTNLFSFPPRLIYQHENSTAVSMYFNRDCVITNPITGEQIPAPRGTLFGQLTLAGHGVSFSSFDIDTFQTEIETEAENGTMPLVATPITSVQIQDFSPDYNAVPFPAALSGGRLEVNGSFVFNISGLHLRTTNYLQTHDGFSAGGWQTIATIVPTTNTFTFVDAAATNHAQRFYRLIGAP